MVLQTSGEGRGAVPCPAWAPFTPGSRQRHLLPLIITLLVDSGLQERLDPRLWLRNRVGTV